MNLLPTGGAILGSAVRDAAIARERESDPRTASAAERTGGTAR